MEKEPEQFITNACVLLRSSFGFCVSRGKKLLYLRKDCERAFLLEVQRGWGKIPRKTPGKTPRNPSVS